LDPIEYASISRSMIEHENALLNHRMTWMWTLQGMLIGATAFTWETSLLLLSIISFLGFVAAVSFGLSFLSSLRAINNIIEGWHQFSASNPGYDGPPIIGSNRKGNIHTLFKPWGALPWLVALLWLVIIGLKYCGFAT
jgi:hypothetical protein